MKSKRRPARDKRRAGRSEANLGQKEAVLEKASDTQLSHMEGGKAADEARRKKQKAKSK